MGKVITIQTASHQYVADIKNAILDVEGVPLGQQRLVFDRKQLKDSQRVYEVGIEPNATVHMVLRLRGGGCPTYYMDDSLLDPTFDYDFSFKEDDGTPFYRGGKRYYRPYGWKRYALNVTTTIRGSDERATAQIRVPANGPFRTTEQPLRQAVA